VTILAHELGHAMDFDDHPAHITLTSALHWTEVPTFIEQAAFVNGFRIMKELHIPVSLENYASMIDENLADDVVAQIEKDHLCCLLSKERPAQRPKLRNALIAAAQ
jgi:hypothetical protein